jgi:molybdopterin-guanine dinucleotide biosynthesis protein A
MTVVGAVLAGGLGRRMGGQKAVVSLGGRSLAEHPLAALRGAGIEEVAIVCKRDSAVPAGVTVWLEPDEPRHPLTGLIHALREADGRPVFACAADLVLLDAATVQRVIAAALPGDLAVVPESGDQLQPLCAFYAPGALPILEAAAPDVALTATVLSLAPRVVPFDDETPFFNVNTTVDLARAETLLSRR